MTAPASATPSHRATPRPPRPSAEAPTRLGKTATATPLPHRGWSKGKLIDGRFEVLDHLGDGGMSSVYLCKDRMLESLAAVKVLTRTESDLPQRFANERRILANLRHPHLVDVLARGVADDGAPFIALEYLSGHSLRDYLRREGPMRWRDVVEVGISVASALGALHDAGVIHRDVKPGNIMVGSRRGPPIYKLIDTGIAKVESWTRVQDGVTPAPRHETVEGKVVGTKGYTPPERASARPNPRFDVFGLGQTMYELLTGEQADPFDIRPMCERWPTCDVPPELEATIRAALDPLEAERIPDAHELRRHLEAVRWARAPERNSVLFAERYEIVELLGIGGKSEVFRAYHREAGFYLALKRLRHGASETERVRFTQEALALAAVSDPGIPRFLDCRTSGGEPYIAMELASGKPALAYCERSTRLEPREVIAVGLQLAGTLAALHARGILHRDVNASNVLIDFPRAPARHHRPIVKLVDFGMAELEDKFYAVAELRYTPPFESRPKVGSGGLEHLDWTAPEARVGRGWSSACDVWSLGFLLYRLLTGLKPVDAQGRLVPPSKIVSTCPRGLEDAVLGALAADPAQRLSLPQLIDRLEGIDEELAAEADLLGAEAKQAAARPTPQVSETLAPTPANEPTAPRRPLLRVVGLAALLGSLVLGGLCVRRTQGPETTPEPGTATPAASRPSPPMTPGLPSVTEALAGAAPTLKRCAEKAGVPLIVEFTTAADRTTFVSAKALLNDDPEVARCIGDALATVRFTPPADAPPLMEEYVP